MPKIITTTAPIDTLTGIATADILVPERADATVVAESVFELKLELKLGRMLNPEDVMLVLDDAVVKRTAEIEDPSTYMTLWNNDIRGGDVEDISDTDEDDVDDISDTDVDDISDIDMDDISDTDVDDISDIDVDDISDTDEDNDVIDVAVPSFDPMENRLKALGPGQQLR